MKELQLYILKKLAIGVCCLLTSFSPVNLYAQDQEDSVAMYSDSAIAIDSESDSNESDKESADGVVLRTVPDTTVERMKREKAFAYANDPAYWMKDKKVYRKGFWDYVFDFFTSSEVRFI